MKPATALVLALAWTLGGDKSVFFQLSAGPVAGESEARALCDEIKRRRLYCEPVAL